MADIKSILKPEHSVLGGLAVGALVIGIYGQSVPNTAVSRATNANDANIDSGRKKAAYLASAVVAGVALATHDLNIFILGSAIVVVMDWHIRHANSTAPDTGQVVTNDVTAPATLVSVAS